VAFCPTVIGLHLGGGAPSPRRRAGLHCLFAFGVVMSVAGFYFTDNNAAELVRACRAPL
jgi:hypothetical protein